MAPAPRETALGRANLAASGDSDCTFEPEAKGGLVAGVEVDPEGGEGVSGPKGASRVSRGVEGESEVVEPSEIKVPDRARDGEE